MTENESLPSLQPFMALVCTAMDMMATMIKAEQNWRTDPPWPLLYTALITKPPFAI